VKFGHAVFEIHEQTDRQTDRQTYKKVPNISAGSVQDMFKAVWDLKQ